MDQLKTPAQLVSGRVKGILLNYFTDEDGLHPLKDNRIQIYLNNDSDGKLYNLFSREGAGPADVFAWAAVAMHSYESKTNVEVEVEPFDNVDVTGNYFIDAMKPA
ncbi:hypothetical protein [Novosphingobium sp.]|uniref:hypothetical protein n=1 Tax=Novosphingobium sp. TaxID=1874826 RepID=UPI0025DD2627|nr:hypothetical protein [Novosphingobium sp.]